MPPDGAYHNLSLERPGNSKAHKVHDRARFEEVQGVHLICLEDEMDLLDSRSRIKLMRGLHSARLR